MRLDPGGADARYVDTTQSTGCAARRRVQQQPAQLELRVRLHGVRPSRSRGRRAGTDNHEGRLAVLSVNPTQTQRGLAGVAGQCGVFQKRTPGGSFVAEEMLAFESHGIVRWRLLDAQGNSGAFDVYGFDYGYDVVEFDAEGRIESLLMFVHTKGARLTCL